MDNAGNVAVAKILEQSGVKKLRFSAQTPNDIELISDKPLTPEGVAHGEVLVDNFLEHFGVKGMKWGVRRSRKQLAKAAKHREKAEKAEAKAGGKSGGSKTKSSGKKKAKDMSDDELKTVLKRMEMEKKYNTLTAPKANPVVAAGKGIVANATKGVMQTSLQAVGQSYATKYTAQYMANATKPSSAPKLPSKQGPLRPPSSGGRS